MTIAAVASYRPLHAIDGAGALLQWSWDAPMQALLTQQLRGPATEHELRAHIPALTSIADGVSQDVRDQYEQNPYPRWVKIAGAQRKMRIADRMRAQFPDAPFQDVGFDNPCLLEAGCGTGQAINETAQSIENVQILAIDLSLASLAYAKRKTDELGLRNIEYAHADIARMPETGRRFDIIQSGGSLHHMADPFAAWAGLITMLKPGGLMRIALYSERGRARIVAARDLIAAAGHPPTPDGIRAMRREILRLRADHPAASIIGDIDFYSLSECRDLVFHVQEHRLTLSQIADFISGERLTFLGFELRATARDAYRKQFPDDRAMTDLAARDAFEADHPDTFRLMSDFWVQKPA